MNRTGGEKVGNIAISIAAKSDHIRAVHFAVEKRADLAPALQSPSRTDHVLDGQHAV
jgi:hypothetical protein